MSPIRNLLLGLLLIAAAFPATTYALSCKLDQPSQPTKFTEALGTALVVPADVPDGTIIWESELHSLPVICADDHETGISEVIFFWVNPANVSVGEGIRVGIRYGTKIINQTSGPVSTDYDSMYGCNWSNCTGWNKARFTLTFSVYIEKYGKTPSSGQASQLSEYRVFQLDGYRGLNGRPNSNLNYVITGLDNIRFVPCSPELTVTPSVVNFHRISSSSAQIGQIAGSANFSLDLRRTCDTPYAVNARFTPVEGSASVIENLMVPQENRSVGIALTRLDSNQPVAFNTWFKLSDLTAAGLVRNEFRADLIWRTKPLTGTFEATALIDLFYM